MSDSLEASAEKALIAFLGEEEELKPLLMHRWEMATPGKVVPVIVIASEKGRPTVAPGIEEVPMSITVYDNVSSKKPGSGPDVLDDLVNRVAAKMTTKDDEVMTRRQLRALLSNNELQVYGVKFGTDGSRRVEKTHRTHSFPLSLVCCQL